MTSISQIIAQDGIRPGAPMHKLNGTEIRDSVVIDGHAFLARRADARGGCDLHYENPLTGETSTRWFSDGALAVLRSSAT